MSQVVVSTECPTCSGPLDFSQGTNAIRCPSCGSTLLVTGRKQVLSYWVAPKVKAEVAGAAARTGRLGARVARAQLFFVPFYRLTGHDFQWQDVPPKPAPETGPLPSMLMGGADRSAERVELDLPLGSVLGWGADLVLGKRAGDAVRDLFEVEEKPERSIEPVVITAARPAASRVTDAPVELLDRYVEKTFPAANLPGLAVHSLGIRTQVLRVSLFQRETLAALGTVVAAQIDHAAALAQGLTARGFEHVVYRQVLGRILSLIYFPFWVVELAQAGERWLTIVDGVAESVVQPRVSLDLYDALAREQAGDDRTVALRPLVCPNCGGDLPVTPDDVILFCSSCHRAWQIHGAELGEARHEVAELEEAGRAADQVYLPFWRLGPEPRVWIPAFRYRRLKALHDLATRLSAKPPAYRPWTGERPELRGCFYDADDAVRLARFAAAGRRRSPDAVKAAAAAEPEFTEAQLAWIPFRRSSQSLLDPSTGFALQEALIG